MDSVLDLLSPDQVDAILATYDSVAIWFSQITTSVHQAIESIVVDDVIL